MGDCVVAFFSFLNYMKYFCFCIRLINVIKNSGMKITRLLKKGGLVWNSL